MKQGNKEKKGNKANEVNEEKVYLLKDHLKNKDEANYYVLPRIKKRSMIGESGLKELGYGDEEISELKNNKEISEISSSEGLKDENGKYRYYGKNDIRSMIEINKEHTKRRTDNTKESFLGLSKFKSTTKVFIPEAGEVYNHVTRVEKENNTYFESQYSLYHGVVASGNKPIIIKTKYKIDKGDNKLYLAPMSDEKLNKTIENMDKGGIFNLCKAFSISYSQKTIEDMKSEILDLKDWFFEPILPVDKEEIKSLKNPFQKIKEILRNGLDKDELMDYISMADIPEVNPHLVEPRNYMKYAPHKIIITNAKVGKSFNSWLITGDSALERPTESGLLGFADGKGKSYGILHGRTKQTYVEEVQEEKEEELFGKCHAYMEGGETYIARGVGVYISGHSGITFQGNPKDKEEETSGVLSNYIMIKQFREFLNTISKNTKPIASRMGVTIFNNNLKTIKGKPKNSDIIDKGHKIIKAIAEGFKDEFTEVLKDDKVVDFLETDFKQDYKNAVLSISQNCDDRTVKDYIEGQIGSYRHCKGVALRLAWLEKGLIDLWENGEVNTEELVECAEEHLENLKARNIESFKNIVNVLNSEAYEEIQKYNIRNIKPEYVRLAVYSLFEWLSEFPENKDEIVPLAEVEGAFQKVKDFLGLKQNHRYYSFSRIKEAFRSYRTNTSKFEEMGLDFDYQNQKFIFLNREKLNKYVKLYNNDKQSYKKDSRKEISKKVEKEKRTETPKPEKEKQETEKSKPKPKRTYISDKDKNTDDIIKIVEENDTGEGMDFNEILNESNWETDKLDKEINRLSFNGYLFEVEGSRWKVRK